MIRRYSKSMLTDLWKLRAGITTLDCGCSVSRQDGSDLNSLIEYDIEKWYANLLLTAPVELLPVEDIATEAAELYLGDNSALIKLPDDGVRLVAVRCLGWNYDLTSFVSPNSDIARIQRNPLLRASTNNPVAVLDGRNLLVYGVMPPDNVVVAPQNSDDAEPQLSVDSDLNPLSKVLKSLKMIVKPPEGFYIFDDSLLPIDTPTFFSEYQ